MQECINNADASIIAQAQQIVDGGLRKEMTTLINRVLNGTQSTIFENRLIVQEFYLGFLTRCLFSCLIDADRTDSADFEFPVSRLSCAHKPRPIGHKRSNAWKINWPHLTQTRP